MTVGHPRPGSAPRSTPALDSAEYDSRSVSDDHHDALRKGARVKEFKILRVLGQGGFGITYLVFDLNLNSPVALKEYFPAGYARRLGKGSVEPTSPESRTVFDWGLKSFLTEAQAIHRLRHPNVVRAHRYFEDRGSAFIVMDYEEGDSLAKILEDRRKLTFAEWRPLFDRLLDGLEHVHDHDYLHRDLKPGNIVIRDTDGAPVLIDFGSARFAAGERTNTQMVTPGYAPIEQYGRRTQGPPADLYALAAVSYRVLVGERPPSAPDRVTNDTIARLEQRVHGADRAWLAALDRCLAIQPKDRPPSVATLRTEFRKPSHTSNSPAVQEYRLRFGLPKSGRGMALVRNVAAPFDDWAVRRWVGRRSSGAINATVFAPFHRALGTDAGGEPLFERRVASQNDGFVWLLELEESGAIEEAARGRIKSFAGPQARSNPPPSVPPPTRGAEHSSARTDRPSADQVAELPEESNRSSSLQEHQRTPHAPQAPSGRMRNPGAIVLWLWYGSLMAGMCGESSGGDALWWAGVGLTLAALVSVVAAFRVGKQSGAVMLGVLAALAMSTLGIRQEQRIHMRYGPSTAESYPDARHPPSEPPPLVVKSLWNHPGAPAEYKRTLADIVWGAEVAGSTRPAIGPPKPFYTRVGGALWDDPLPESGLHPDAYRLWIERASIPEERVARRAMVERVIGDAPTAWDGMSLEELDLAPLTGNPEDDAALWAMMNQLSRGPGDRALPPSIPSAVTAAKLWIPGVVAAMKTWIPGFDERGAHRVVTILAMRSKAALTDAATTNRAVLDAWGWVLVALYLGGGAAIWLVGRRFCWLSQSAKSGHSQ